MGIPIKLWCSYPSSQIFIGILTMEVAEVPTLCNNITTVVANITGV